MRTAILGAGGIGGYLGAKLLSAGQDVSVIARGAHLEAIRAGGLRLVEPDGETVVRPALATADAGEIGPVDLVIVAVKGQDLPAALESAAPLVGDGTRVLPFQNGVDAPRLVAERFGEAAALTGVARILANITAPGVVTRYGAIRTFTVGDAGGSQADDRVAAIRAMFDGAGIIAPDCPDVIGDMWTKFVFFNALSGTTAGARCTMAEVRGTPELKALFRTLAEEALAVGLAEDAGIDSGTVEQALKAMATLPDEARASMAHDLEQGRPLEVDWICGAVGRLGRRHGLETPASDTVTALLAPWRAGRA